MAEGVVYLLTFPNGKRYVGVTYQLHKRLQGHSTAPTVVGNAWRKHGSPLVATLFRGPLEQCYLLESTFIEEHNSLLPLGYNQSIGGRGGTKGRPHTEATKAKMRASQKARPTISEETREKLRQIGLQRDTSKLTQAGADARRGKSLSPEHKAVLSERARQQWAARRSSR